MASYFEPGRGNAIKVIDGKKVRGGYRYDFQLFGQRHHAARGFDRKSDSDDAEQELRRRLKLEHAGVAVLPAANSSPRFANWGGVYKAWVYAQATLGLLKRPDAIAHNISSVLRFWGERPTEPGAYVHPGAPYRNLTLEDPIRDPSLLLDFETWMTSEGIAGSTRNHYLTTMSGMYRLALRAEYRQASGAPHYNPFRDRGRARWKRRTAIITVDELQRWIQHASYHTRLAIAIATLNSKFRLTNILQLEWRDVDFANRLITVWDHKTDDDGTALVATIPEQLVRILDDARTRHPHATRVILYRGEPVKSIDESVKAAAIAAKLTWGRNGGVTFHSIRHFASTHMARMNVPLEVRMNVSGHRDLEMERWYTHLFPEDERAYAEAFSATVPIAAAVTAGPRRVSRAKADSPATSAPASGAASRQQPAFTAPPGGNSDAGGNAGGAITAKQGDLGVSRALRGLWRGPQPRAEKPAK